MRDNGTTAEGLNRNGGCCHEATAEERDGRSESNRVIVPSVQHVANTVLETNAASVIVLVRSGITVK
jgi:hypothetical protein